jgi:citrate synthase
MYRRYLLNELVARASFSEIACLLVDGVRPDSSRLERFEQLAVDSRRRVRSGLKLRQSLTLGPLPLVALGSGIAVCGPYEDVEVSDRLIGVAPRLITELSIAGRAGRGVEVAEAGTHIEAVRAAVCGISRTPLGPKTEQLRLLNVLLTIYAEHGMNCSTTAVRTLMSAGASKPAAVAGGMFCFSGEMHGGAADRVGKMLRSIYSSRLSASQWLDSVMQYPRFRLHGFGHRLYKIPDPRIQLLLTALNRYLTFDSYEDVLHKVAVDLASSASERKYFSDRKLHPNVDLFVGGCLRALGIPDHLSSTVMALGRMSGWLAHCREEGASDSPIVRPRDRYVGAREARPWCAE